MAPAGAAAIANESSSIGATPGWAEERKWSIDPSSGVKAPALNADRSTELLGGGDPVAFGGTAAGWLAPVASVEPRADTAGLDGAADGAAAILN